MLLLHSNFLGMENADYNISSWVFYISELDIFQLISLGLGSDLIHHFYLKK